jgi:hypothetical protein
MEVIRTIKPGMPSGKRPGIELLLKAFRGRRNRYARLRWPQ